MDLEGQNNERLEELHGKISSLRSVTTDIQRAAADHQLIDRSQEIFTSLAGSIRASGEKLAHTSKRWPQWKLVAGITGGVLALYYFLL